MMPSDSFASSETRDSTIGRGAQSLRARLMLISIATTLLLSLSLVGLLSIANLTRESRIVGYLSASFDATCTDVLQTLSGRLLEGLQSVARQLSPYARDTAEAEPALAMTSSDLPASARILLLPADPSIAGDRGSPDGLDPALNRASIQQLIQRNGSTRGLFMGTPGVASASGLGLIAAVGVDSGRMLIVTADLTQAVQRIESLFQGRVFIRDTEGTIRLTSTNPMPPGMDSQLSDLRGYQQVNHGGIYYEVLGTSLVDFTGRRVGSIHLVREDDGRVATEQLIRHAAITVAILCVALFVVGLALMLRYELSPLVRVARMVNALSRQDLTVPAVESGNSAEVRRMVEAVESLRAAALDRDRLSFSLATNHGRERAMIEAELRSFANMLDDAERGDVLAKLEQVRSGGRPTDSLADLGADSSLAMAFRFMSGRVRAQQARVHALLAERTADLETVRRALSERSDLFRLREELEVARQLQVSLLPDAHSLSTISDRLELDAITRPAKEVGGDSYDFQLIHDGRTLQFLICDSSGKGVPAAMFVLTSRSLASAACEAIGRLDTGLRVTNAALARENDALSFTTMFIAQIDLESGVLTYSNAGHNPPLLQRANGALEWLGRQTGLVLGAMEESQYEQYSVPLEPGDTLILYTDGVTEAHDAEGRLFAIERLEAAARLATGSPGERIRFILTAVDSFAGDTPPFDDITLMVLRYRGARSAR